MTIYKDIRASLFNLCKDYVDSISSSNVQVFDFDSITQETVYPEAVSLIGIAELSLTKHEEQHTGTCMIVCCTANTDTNSEELVTHTSALYDKITIGVPIGQLKNASTGNPIGNIIVTEVTILPYGKVKTKPTQEIAIGFGVALFPTP